MSGLDTGGKVGGGPVEGGPLTMASCAAPGIGTADTSEIIKAKISATRPARERIYEYFMIVGPAG